MGQGVRAFDFAKSLDALENVLLSLLPLLVFSVVLSAAICAVFMVLLPLLGRVLTARPDPVAVNAANGQLAADGVPAPIPAPVVPDTGSTLSYVLMTALLGLIVGMLVNQIGGLQMLSRQQAGGSFVEAIVSTLVVALGAVGTLLADGSNLEIRRPMGLTAFLTSFLVSGLYWATMNA